MYGINEWYIFNQALNKKICNKIKRLAQGNWVGASVDTKTTTLDEERITGRKGDFKPDSKARISDVAWTNDQWIYDLIFPYMDLANVKAGLGI